MIHVVVRVTLRPGLAPAFLREFRELAILVRQEAGCLDYFPAQDIRTGLEAQSFDPDCVTIMERWSSRQALESHLRSGHMRGFQDRIKGLVRNLEMSIVEEV